MLKSLNYCYKNKKAVSLFCNRNDTEQHLTGFIGKVNDSEVLIYHITNCGYYDGYILKRIDDIFRIDYEGEYEKKFKCCMNIGIKHIEKSIHLTMIMIRYSFHYWILL